MDRALKLTLFIPLVRKPREGDNSWIDHPLITDLLGLFESLDQAHAAHGYLSTISCLITVTCMIGKMPVC